MTAPQRRPLRHTPPALLTPRPCPSCGQPTYLTDIGPAIVQLDPPSPDVQDGFQYDPRINEWTDRHWSTHRPNGRDTYPLHHCPPALF